MRNIKELENALLDQIEKLNDDSIAEDSDKAKTLIERSRAMSELADSYIGVSRMKLDVVKELNRSGGLYEDYLGIEDKQTVLTKKGKRASLGCRD